MRFLLDTHAFLWWVIDSPKLSVDAREIIADENNEPVFSVVSAWEIAINRHKSRCWEVGATRYTREFVTDQLIQNGLEVLPIHLRHALYVYALPDYHRDPFDRLLAAQAVTEDLAVLTADPFVTRYPVQTIW